MLTIVLYIMLYCLQSQGHAGVSLHSCQHMTLTATKCIQCLIVSTVKHWFVATVLGFCALRQ